MDVNAAAVDDDKIFIITRQAVSVFVKLLADRVPWDYTLLERIGDVSSFAEEAGAISIVNIAVVWSFCLIDAFVSHQLVTRVAHNANSSIRVSHHARLTVLYANAAHQGPSLTTLRAWGLTVDAVESSYT